MATMVSSQIVEYKVAQRKAEEHHKIEEFMEEDGVYIKMLKPSYSHKWVLVFTPEDQEILKQIKRD